MKLLLNNGVYQYFIILHRIVLGVIFIIFFCIIKLMIFYYDIPEKDRLCLKISLKVLFTPRLRS